MIKSIENQFKSSMTDAKLVDIRLYQVNDHYYNLPDKKLCIIDAGIEFIFNLDSFSFAWNQELGAFNFRKNEFIQTYQDDNFRELNHELIKSLGKDKIVEVDFKWIDYEIIIDYTMTTKKESGLVEILLTFESGDSLQIATVGFEFNKDNFPDKFYYDITGQLLLSVNNYIDIKQI
jgi:hypothetical protein